MHDEILNELEEYLSSEPVSRSFTQHLEVCPPCAREVEEMEIIALAILSATSIIYCISQTSIVATEKCEKK